MSLHFALDLHMFYLNSWNVVNGSNDLSSSLAPFILSLFESAGTNHCWLNRLDKNIQLSRGDGTFLVLTARTFDNGIMFENLKKLKQR